MEFICVLRGNSVYKRIVYALCVYTVFACTLVFLSYIFYIVLF